MSGNKLTRDELAAKYVAAIADAKSGKAEVSVLATDLSLYLGQLQPWFDEAMVFWSNYVSNEVRRGSLSPPAKRSVVRYVPLRDPVFTHIAEAQEYWLQIKVGMHWLLCPGPYNLVTFGQLENSMLKELTYCVVPKVMMVETPGVYDGNFDTAIRFESHGRITNRVDFFQSLMPSISLDNIDPAKQEVFPIYYRGDTFKARRQSGAYFRGVLGRFLWKLQTGICSYCGVDTKYSYHEMEIDHIIPINRGGNNSLLNTEMKCRQHNNQKNKRLSETRDYLTVLRNVIGVKSLLNPTLNTIFSMEETNIEFPVHFAFTFA